MADKDRLAARNDRRALRLPSNVDAEWWAPARHRLTRVRLRLHEALGPAAYIGDVARKALILARELGLSVSQEDVEVEPFVPEQLLAEEDVERFLGSLEAWDKTFASRMEGLRVEPPAKEGWRPVLKVGPIAVPHEHPAARLRGAEALVAFTTPGQGAHGRSALQDATSGRWEKTGASASIVKARSCR